MSNHSSLSYRMEIDYQNDLSMNKNKTQSPETVRRTTTSSYTNIFKELNVNKTSTGTQSKSTAYSNPEEYLQEKISNWENVIPFSQLTFRCSMKFISLCNWVNKEQSLFDRVFDGFKFTHQIHKGEWLSFLKQSIRIYTHINLYFAPFWIDWLIDVIQCSQGTKI